jgi:predicted negative regulator of RcsB-dependent stress response
MNDDNKNTTSTPRPAQREAARKTAQNHFAASEKRDTEVRKEIARQQAATQTQMAKLRALRLAKEEADRIEAANAPPPVRKTKSRKVKPAA